MTQVINVLMILGVGPVVPRTVANVRRPRPFLSLHPRTRGASADDTAQLKVQDKYNFTFRTASLCIFMAH